MVRYFGLLEVCVNFYGKCDIEHVDQGMFPEVNLLCLGFQFLGGGSEGIPPVGEQDPRTP